MYPILSLIQQFNKRLLCARYTGYIYPNKQDMMVVMNFARNTDILTQVCSQASVTC